MTAPIDIEKIFPSFELLTAGDNPDADTGADETNASLDPTQGAGLATLASGAVSTVSVDNAGTFYTTPPAVTLSAPAGGASVAQVNSSVAVTVTGIPASGKKLSVDGTDITFGDVASGTGDVKTDIVGTSEVVEGTATGTIAISASPNVLLAGASITIDGITFEEGGSNGGGTDWGRSGTNADAATNLAAAIDAQANFVASAAGTDITVSYASAGSAGNVAITYGTGYTTGPAALENGVDAVAAGDAKDDFAASIAQYIRATGGGLANFSAEAASNIVTISYTGSNGTDPASPVGDTKSVTTDAAAISGVGSLTSGAVEFRTATATAALFAETDATNRGTIETITVVDAGSGYSGVPTVTIPVAHGNVIEKIGKLGADMVSGGGSFDYAKDYIAIALEDFNINNASGVLKNPLSSSEASENTGDFRKLVYHILRRVETYLSEQESVASVAVSTAGTLYDAADTVAITGGGGSGATASLTVDTGTGAITGVAVDTAGSGYTSTPSAVITTSTGSSAVLDVTLSTNTPAKFTCSKGFLSENTATDEVSRDYTTSFTFDESGLEMSAES